MSWSKSNKSLAFCAGILLALGAIFGAVKLIQWQRENSAWGRITGPNRKQLEAVPEFVSIRPTKFDKRQEAFVGGNGTKMLGINVPSAGLLGHAYEVRRTRIVNPNLLPKGRYDVIVSLPDHQMEAFQAAIKKKFGLTARKERRDTQVYVLTVSKTDAPGLKPASGNNAGPSFNNGHVKWDNMELGGLARMLEMQTHVPVVDNTGLTNRYDMDFTLDMSALQNGGFKEVERVLAEQTGLQLTPGVQNIEMLRLVK
jgi:uncharacterized protein (TIGR03435 family)